MAMNAMVLVPKHVVQFVFERINACHCSTAVSAITGPHTGQYMLMSLGKDTQAHVN